MKYSIIFSTEAKQDYDELPAFIRAAVRDGIDKHQQYGPERESKSRIKRLRGLEKPEYRLRLGDIRVFYDVRAEDVEVLGIVDKKDAEDGLRKRGVTS